MKGWASPAEVAVLFGAGVGVDAGLPSAAQLIASIADAFVLDAKWAAEFAALSQPQGPVRFETAMDWLSETADEDLHVLSFLDRAEPGPLHETLAWAASQGARLVTVNFDDLAEGALAALGVTPWTTDAHNAEQEAPPGTVPVLKLHGTRRRYDSAGVHAAAKPLHATITEIVRAGGGAGLPARAHERLADAVDGLPLLVVGYSGSDDLDVMPSLQRCTPASVLWIQHEPGAPREVPLEQEATAGTAKLLCAWAAAGVPVRKLAGETRRALRELGWTVPDPLPAKEWARRRSRWQKEIRAWAAVAHGEDPTGLGWVALTLGTSGYYARSRDAVLESVPSAKPDGLWSKQRRLYELAQSTYQLPDSSVAEVVELAEQARDCAVERSDSGFAANAEIMIARALTGDRRYDEAGQALTRAEAFLADEKPSPRHDYGRAYLDLWTGRVHLLKGETQAAAQAASAAAERYRSLGDWAAVSESLQIVGQAAWSGDDLEAAVEPLEQAIEIARRGPYPDQLEAALHRRAMVAYYAGDVESAYAYGKESADVCLEYELMSEIAESLTPWGLAANELDRHEEAKTALRQARTYCTPFEDTAWRPDIVLTLADSLFHLGEAEEALAVLEEERATVERDPWDVAHAAAIRWRSGRCSKEAADEAIRAAADADPYPYARQALCILRLGISGAAAQELLDYALGVVRENPHRPRQRRLEAWLELGASS